MRLHGTNASCCNNSFNAHNVEKAYVIRNLCNLITYQIIMIDLKEMGGGCGDWMELDQDRDRWRVLVSTVMNLRVP